MDESRVRSQLRGFVEANYLFGDSSRLPDDSASLMDLGLIDSTGILELIEFLEEEFGIQVREEETLPHNLGSIDALTGYVISKTGH